MGMNFVACKRRKAEENRNIEDQENVQQSSKDRVYSSDLSPVIGCLDLKMRHGSTVPRHGAAVSALTKLLNIFRSKSEPSVESKSQSSSSKSPRPSKSTSSSSSKKSRSASAGAGGAEPRRRYIRVVRDAAAAAPEVVDDNPHTICRYSQSFLQEHYLRKSEEDEESAAANPDRPPLPYVTSGHTILKKSSTDPTPSSAGDPPERHATFKEFVEVIEYIGHDMVEAGALSSHEARLQDGDGSSEGRMSPEAERSGFFLRNDPGADDGDGATDPDVAETGDESRVGDDDDDYGLEGLRNVDLDRMDGGAMQNIFSPFSEGGGAEASPEPLPLRTTRRVELSELINQAALEERR